MSNQWTADAPYTAEDLHRLYHDDGMSQLEMADHYGVRQSTISRHMKRAGITSRKAIARSQAGSKNNNWRGGRIMAAKRPGKPNIESGGYWYIWMPDHPNATKAGYVAEHIAIAAPGGIGTDECVHHINLRKQDNRPENLIVLTRQEHAELHAQLGALAGSMVESGLIVFDAKGGYRLAS